MPPRYQDSAPDEVRRAHAGPPEEITIAIPARNEERSIGRCLDSVLRQTERDLQVVVVDGASEDATVDVVRSYAARDRRVELVKNPTATIPSSMNLALRAARGRWFVRIDAHSQVPPGYVADVVAHLSSGQWAGVGGRKDGVGVTSAGRAIAAAMGSRFGVGNSVYHYGTAPQTTDHVPFGAYPTELLRELGGWDERLLANEDFELDHRIGLSGRLLLFDPQLRITWECRQRIPELFRRYRRYGRAKIAVARLHPRSVRLRHLSAPLLVAELAGVGLVASRNRKLAAAALAPYLALLTVASINTARRVQGAAARAWVPVAFLAMHLGWGIGFWEGAVAALRDRALPGRGTDGAR